VTRDGGARTLGERAVLLRLGRLEGLLGLVHQVVLVVLTLGQDAVLVLGLDSAGVEEAVEEAGDEGGVPEDLGGGQGRARGKKSEEGKRMFAVRARTTSKASVRQTGREEAGTTFERVDPRQIASEERGRRTAGQPRTLSLGKRARHVCRSAGRTLVVCEAILSERERR
jgi:hypothetical protein